MPNNQTYFDGIINQLQENTIIGTLDLSNQGLTDFDVEALVVELFNPQSMVSTLLLNNNTITDVGSTAVANLLKANTQLTGIGISFNKITDIGATALAGGLAKNKFLRTLGVAANPFTSIGATAFANALEINVALQEIHFGENPIGLAGMQALLIMLKTNRSLTSISVDSVVPGAQEIQLLADAVAVNNVLIVISVDQLNANTITTSQALLNALMNNYSLLFLINSEGSAAAPLLARNAAVQEAIAGLKANTLITLDLSSMQITDAGVVLIAEVLKRNISLSILDLHSNPIGSVGGTAIATALKENAFLTILDCRYNQLGDAGTIAIAEALIQNTVLQELDLWSNNIGLPGAQAMASALRVNNVLRIIDFYGNQMGDAGAIVMATMLMENGSLIAFGMENNGITDVGMANLAAALKINKSLTAFAFWGNPITNTGAGYLAEALQINVSLDYITLWTSKIDDTGVQALLTVLKNNYSLTQLYFTCCGLAPDVTQSTLNQVNSLLARNSQYLQFGVESNIVRFANVRMSTNNIRITQGQKLILTPQNVKASGVNNSTITYTVTTNYGDIVNATTNKPINQFTDADIATNEIAVITDGSINPFACNVTATNGTVTTVPHPTAVIFIPQTNPPTIINNHFTLSQNKTTLITSDQLSASFVNLTTPQGGLVFNMMNVTGGQFQEVGQTTPVFEFQQQLVIDNQLEFACDNSGNAPSCNIIVGDSSNHTSGIVPAKVTFTPITTTTTTTTSTSISTTTLRHPPVLLNPIANQTIAAGDPFELQIPNNTFSDPDGEPLRFSLTDASGAGLPAWLHFNASSGVLSGIPNQVGNDTLRVTAEDAGNLSVATDFNLDVLPKPTSSSSADTTHTTITTTTSASITTDLTKSTASSSGINAGIAVGAGVAGLLIGVVGVGLFRRCRGKTEITVAPQEQVALDMIENPIHASRSASWSETQYAVTHHAEDSAQSVYGVTDTRKPTLWLEQKPSALITYEGAVPYDNVIDVEDLSNPTYGFTA